MAAFTPAVLSPGYARIGWSHPTGQVSVGAAGRHASSLVAADLALPRWATIAAICLAGASSMSRNRSCRRQTARQATGSADSPCQSRRHLVSAVVAATAPVPLLSQQAWAETALKEDEVVQVIDGDTVKLAGYGRCRLIGMNTPETVSPKQRLEGAPPDCYGPEASSLTKSLLPPGTKVRVELDVEPTDRYGRELVYLYRSKDGMFINSELVKQGAARHYKVAPNTRYADMFLKLEQEANAAGKGLWKACPAGGSKSGGGAKLTPVGQANDAAKELSKKTCKDFNTYDEAKAFFDAYFPQYGDIAGLDGDKDGKPCEKLLKKSK
eukprot:gb/GFBE01055146.1/.p1 GENE.gb/GFBE01055146.1/~~gb/GFBE01055146.1/.p1  ORF type:complete len:324 (+),score=75.01 gb/GFBE01055146.1/:1-972(+)